METRHNISCMSRIGAVVQCALIAMALLHFASVVLGQSAVTYRYTGNPMLDCPGPPSQYICPGSHLSGSVTLSVPVGYTGSASGQTIESYSLTAPGVWPLPKSVTLTGNCTSSTSVINSLSLVSGKVVGWNLGEEFECPIPPFPVPYGLWDFDYSAIFDSLYTTSSQDSIDDANYNSCDIFGPAAGCLVQEPQTTEENTSTPGIWTLSSVQMGSGSYSLKAVNPFEPYASSRSTPASLASSADYPYDVVNSPQATMLAADAQSAVTLVFQSTSNEPVILGLSASGGGLADGTAVGAISQFDPNYLVSPNPSSGNSKPATIYPTSCDEFNNCTFLALLWGPDTMPNPDAFPSLVTLTITATQEGIPTPISTVVRLVPPPLLLIHGLWDTAEGAGFTPGTGGLYDWIARRYPYGQVFPVNYGIPTTPCSTCGSKELLSAKELDDKQTQDIFAKAVDNALASAAQSGMAARSVDVVAHSLGGLVTRYYESNSGYSENPSLLGNPIHHLITIGTPHLGTNMATVLENSQNNTSPLAYTNPLLESTCAVTKACTLGYLFNNLLGKPIDTAIESLEPSSQQLQDLSFSNQFDAVVGEAPTPISETETFLDLLMSIYIPPQTDLSILGGQVNDTIVPFSSQAPSCGSTCATVPGIVHAALTFPGTAPLDCGETHSAIVWAQAFHWLTGGTGDAPVYFISGACGNPVAPSNSNMSPQIVTLKAHPTDVTASSGPAPVLNLSGYTQVAASNVTILPATGSSLTIGSATSISATSTSKTINELLLLQSIADPTDTFLSFATLSPFTISYTPTRLGTASYSAITVFSDNTYALTPLVYTLQTTGSPASLTLLNAPAVSLNVGESLVVAALAQFPGGPVDVTQAATYTSQSGGSSVFSVGTGGTITATGIGADQLNVLYGGVTSSANMTVGACTYALNPSGEVVPYTGGSVSVAVTAPGGCAWTATGGSSWLTFANASGVGNGTITLTAIANTTGSAQSATISLANVSVLVEQATTACTYGLSQSQINAPAGGIIGTINVTTSCPVVASSNASWVTATASTSSVSYTVTPNTGTSQRTATLTVGTQALPVIQPAAVTPTVTVMPGSSSITTLQSLSVAVTVSGGNGNPTPTGTVTLTSGGYTSASAALTNGSATMSIPPGSLAIGSDTLTTGYTPDSNSFSTFLSATGSTASPVTVTQATITPTVMVTPASSSITTAQALTVTVVVGGGTGNPTPTGSVALTSVGYTSGAVILSSGSAMITVPLGSLATGTDALTVNFTPDLASSSIYNSATSIASVVVTLPTAATPVFSPATGTYTSAQSVTITDATAGTTIYYTTDGSTPTTLSTKSTAAITVSTMETIKAIAAATGYANSAVASATYTITLPIAATPVFTPAAGTYPSARSVTVADATAGATIHYTTNGTTPTTSSTQYAGAIAVSATETIEAIAVAAGYTNSAVVTATYTIESFAPGALQFIPVTPCRIVDTRNAAGAFGGPELAATSTRTFDIPQSGCGIPSTAVAYSLNATVVPDGELGYLTVYPAGVAQPNVSTLNSDGRVKANATITPAGTSGGVSVYASNATNFILDIDGYFVPAGSSSSGLEFFPVTPCRIADTRNATGPLGGPSMAATTTRAFPVLSSTCGIPATAKAYSLNITAVPHGGLGYLSAWPTGEAQPLVSTLNASTGSVTANAAIVPAGTSGEVSIYVSNDADVILDINGYFAPPATGGLSLYTATPCRVIDTRNGAGAFSGTLTVPVETSSCAPPSAAKAYVLNATVVPTEATVGLGYLSLWPAGAAQPLVSTLNASDAAITSNMAIVPTNNGSVDAYASNPTQLILDISSYFAP
jgi:Chitobiase/beta-hexosaminidase C-terminal domain/Palmitoyl protein thioesterase